MQALLLQEARSASFRALYYGEDDGASSSRLPVLLSFYRRGNGLASLVLANAAEKNRVLRDLLIDDDIRFEYDGLRASSDGGLHGPFSLQFGQVLDLAAFRQTVDALQQQFSLLLTLRIIISDMSWKGFADGIRGGGDAVADAAGRKKKKTEQAYTVPSAEALASVIASQGALIPWLNMLATKHDIGEFIEPRPAVAAADGTAAVAGAAATATAPAAAASAGPAASSSGPAAKRAPQLSSQGGGSSGRGGGGSSWRGKAPEYVMREGPVGPASREPEPRNCHRCHYAREGTLNCPNGFNHNWCCRCAAYAFAVRESEIGFIDAMRWRCPTCEGWCPCTKCRRVQAELPPERRSTISAPWWAVAGPGMIGGAGSRGHPKRLLAGAEDFNVVGGGLGGGGGGLGSDGGGGGGRAGSGGATASEPGQLALRYAERTTAEQTYEFFFAKYFWSLPVTRQAPGMSEDVCFVCKDGGLLLECDVALEGGDGKCTCQKVYHPFCLGFAVAEDEDLRCARHRCAECDAPSARACRFCPVALCDAHFRENPYGLVAAAELAPVEAAAPAAAAAAKEAAAAAKEEAAAAAKEEAAAAAKEGTAGKGSAAATPARRGKKAAATAAAKASKGEAAKEAAAGSGAKKRRLWADGPEVVPEFLCRDCDVIMRSANLNFGYLPADALQATVPGATF